MMSVPAVSSVGESILIDRTTGIQDSPARLVASMAGITDEAVIELAGLCLAAAAESHTCIDLRELPVSDDGVLSKLASESVEKGDFLNLVKKRLVASPGVRVLGDVECPELAESTRDLRPLVLVGDLLYTQRQFVDELSVAVEVAARLTKAATKRSDRAREMADQLKPRGSDSEANVENDVLRAIADSDFMILTGGPGTGKTTMTITAIALMLTVSDSELGPDNIALCAPTGKAAARLKEAIQDFLSDAKRSAWITQSVRGVLEGIVPTTIHRLLSRSRGMSTRFHYNAQNQLSQKIVAVDEASMISAQLMARLLEATSRDARVLLVGDPGQLESVEAGAVLGQLMLDVSQTKSTSQQRERCVFTLRKVWRTGAGSAIPKLAAAIRSGDADETVRQMRSAGEGLEWIQTQSPQSISDEVAGEVLERLIDVKRLAQEVNNPAAHIQALANASAVKVLCGPREGDRGVAHWNQWLSERLGFSTTDTTSPGRLVMVLENSPRVSLANGDIGLIVAMEDESQAIFPGPTGPRYLPLASLPPVQTCFAMTIHKSQGSEYKDLVVVVLPALESPLLNRQLFYTAVTRTKNRARVVGSEECLRQAVLQVSGRASGLAELLSRNLRSHE